MDITQQNKQSDLDVYRGKNTENLGAVESIGTKTDFNVVNVFYIDRLRQQEFAVPPFFKDHLKNVLYEEDKVTQFQCSVGGHPFPDIEWYKGDEKIAEVSSKEENLGEFIGYKYYATRGDSHLVLIITNVLSEDFGRYTCKIKNAVGEASSTAVLYTLPEGSIKPKNEDSSDISKEPKGVLIKETITVLQRRPRKDVNGCNGRSNDDPIAEEQVSSMNKSAREKLMTLMFSMPENYSTRDIQISTTNYCVDNWKTSRDFDILTIDSRDETLTSPTTTEGESLLQVPNEQNGFREDNLSPETEGEMHIREQWIRCGESSDSEYRRDSIPYPLPRCLTETTEEETAQPNSNQTSVDEIDAGNKNEWVTSWQKKNENQENVDDDESHEYESKDTFGSNECRKLFSIRGNFQYSTSHEYSDGRPEYNDVFETEESRNEDGSEFPYDYEIPTLQDVSPITPDVVELREKDEKSSVQEVVPAEESLVLEEIAVEATSADLECEAPKEQFISSIEVEVVEKPELEATDQQPIDHAENLQQKTPLNISTEVETEKNEEHIQPKILYNGTTVHESQKLSSSDVLQSELTEISSMAPQQEYSVDEKTFEYLMTPLEETGEHMNSGKQENITDKDENPWKKLDELIAMLLEFSQRDYVLVSSLKVGRKGTRHELSDSTKSLTSKKSLLGKETVQLATVSGEFSEKPYLVQRVGMPMHPSDVTGDSDNKLDLEPRKPKFVIPLQDMEVSSEDNIVLNISVTGFPAPHITWYKNGEPLEERDLGEIHDDLDGNKATYTCVATNSSGEAVSSASVTLNRSLEEQVQPLAAVEEEITPNEGVVLRQKKCIVEEGKRYSQIISASLVDYLRWKAKTLQQHHQSETITEEDKRWRSSSFTKAPEHSGALTRDDVTLRRGSMLSLNSIVSTTSFESAEENFASSDAVWEDVISTCEEDFMSTDEFFFPKTNTDFPRLRIPGFTHQDWSSDEDYPTVRPLTPTPVSEQPPFEYEITPTRSKAPFTRTPTDPFLSLQGLETGSSECATPVPTQDEISQLKGVDLDREQPKFLVPLKDLNLGMGSRCTLNCCILGGPETTVAWHRNGIRILSPGPSGSTPPHHFPRSVTDSAIPSPRFSITAKLVEDKHSAVSYTAHTLLILDSRTTDSGEYTITAKNEHGSAISRAKISINEQGDGVHEESTDFSAPCFVTKISDSDGMLGEKVSMTFELTGQPEPDVTILHNKEEVEGTKYELLKDGNSRYTLTIADLQLEDEGEIRICAINVVGFSECYSELFVDERTVTPTPGKFGNTQWPDNADDFDLGVRMDIREQLTSQSTAPYFDDIADDVTTTVGSNASFVVCVYGWPVPEVSWYRNDEKISKDDHISIESTDLGTHVIKISSIKESDAGIYTCIAKNSIGQVSCKAELILPNVNAPASSSDEDEGRETSRRRIKDYYDVLGNIGTGSFSIVRLVRSISDDDSTDYAAKYIRCTKHEWKEKYNNEVTILQKLQHPNIIAYKDHFETKKHIILVTEYIENEWFEYLLEEKEIKEIEIAQQVKQICAALHYLHQKQIVHLDIKPENIMTSSGGNLMKIIDLGSAKVIKGDESTYCNYGNPEFVSPEVIKAEPVSAASDMWAIGVVIFVALSGNPPFHGNSDLATVILVKEGKYEFDERWFAHVSENAKDFIKKLIMMDPSERMSASEANRHPWITNEESAGVFSEGRLKYFCSRRKWQRSLVGPKTSLMIRSIPSLLKQEYDSSSIAAPRSRMSDYISSSTVTESDDETDLLTIQPKPTSPKLRIERPKLSKSPEQTRRLHITSISIEDSIEMQKEPVTTPTLKITASSPNSSPELIRKLKNVESGQNKPSSKFRQKTGRLSPKYQLKFIGKKVSFEDDPSSLQELQEVESPVFQQAVEVESSTPVIQEHETTDIPPVAQMPEIPLPLAASGPPGIKLDRPQSVSKLLKEDKRVEKMRRKEDAESKSKPKENIKKRLGWKSHRRHRSVDARYSSSNSEDEDIRAGSKSSRKRESPSKTKFSLFSRRKRFTTKGISLDSAVGMSKDHGASEENLRESEHSHSSASMPPIKGILKHGGPGSQSDPLIPKFQKPKSTKAKIAANQESMLGPAKYQRRTLTKGMSLDLDMVAEKPDETPDVGKSDRRFTATERRRLEMRRGSSVESALPRKPRSRVSGLRGPLLEKGAGEDEPAIGMALRRSMPVVADSKGLPNHSRSYSGPLDLPSPLGKLSLSPRVPIKSTSPLSRFFFSQSVDIANMTTPSDGFRGRKAQSAQITTSPMLALPRSRSSDHQMGKRSRSADKRKSGETYAPYLKAPLVDQGLTPNQAYATLSCLIDAFPHPQIVWYKDGEEIPSSDRIEIISEPSISRYQLKIRNLYLPGDFGAYSCEASNTVGVISTRCRLMAAVAPEKPSAPEFEGTDGANIWIKWNPPSNCPASPISYLLQYREMAAMKWVVVDDSIRDTVYKVENLRLTTSYRFRVRAINNAGIGPFSKVSQRIQIQPRSQHRGLQYVAL